MRFSLPCQHTLLYIYIPVRLMFTRGMQVSQGFIEQSKKFHRTPLTTLMQWTPPGTRLMGSDAQMLRMFL